MRGKAVDRRSHSLTGAFSRKWGTGVPEYQTARWPREGVPELVVYLQQGWKEGSVTDSLGRFCILGNIISYEYAGLHTWDTAFQSSTQAESCLGSVTSQRKYCILVLCVSGARNAAGPRLEIFVIVENLIHAVGNEASCESDKVECIPYFCD
jgi:hypothetical protein